MDTLPPEIKGEIIRLAIDDLPYKSSLDRSQYATVSREWQAHVEPSLFETIHLDLGSRRLSEAADIMTLQRQSYVRKIHFTIQLPEGGSVMDSLEEKKDSEALFAQLASMLGHLRAWNMPSGKVELILEQYWGAHYPYNCYNAFRLESDTYRQLPEVHSIAKFVISDQSWLSPKTCCEIATRFPRLRNIEWYLDDYHDEAWICGRQDFATALDLIPGSVRDFYLDYRCQSCHRWPGLDPWLRPNTLDPLSLALRRLSMQLEKAFLGFPVGSEFLIGIEALDDSDTSSNSDMHSEKLLWPRLRELTVNATYRTSQNLYSYDGSDRFGSSFHDRVNYHYLICGRAAARMPNLSHMVVDMIDVFKALRTTYTTKRNPRGAEIVFRHAPASVSGLQPYVEEVSCAAARTHLGEGADLRFNVHFRPEDVEEENRLRHLTGDESSELESEGAEEESEVDLNSEGGELGDIDENLWGTGTHMESESSEILFYLERQWACNPKWTHTEEWDCRYDEIFHSLEWTQTV